MDTQTPEQWASNRTDRIQTNMVGRTVWIRTGKDDDGKDVYGSAEVVDVYLERQCEGYDELFYNITCTSSYLDGRTTLLKYSPNNVLLTKPQPREDNQ